MQVPTHSLRQPDHRSPTRASDASESQSFPAVIGRFMENRSPAGAQGRRATATQKRKTPQVIDLRGFIMVRDDGLEPSTQGLRIPCSTN